MKTQIKTRFLFAFTIFTMGIASNYTFAADITEQRKYEPVVLQGGALSHFYDVPVNEIYLYAYADSTQTYEMMPFQIDERILAEDTVTGIWRHSYFYTDDGVLDKDDEIVFLIRDLGEKAPIGIWINNAEAKQHKRLEIKIYDPNDPETNAYCYLFRSSTIQEQVPKKYGLMFHSQEDSVETDYYAVGLNKETGVIEDIVIKPPFGNGDDIFDRQKIRFDGVLEISGAFFPFPLSKESNIVRYNYQKYTKEPIVRIVRETRHTFIDSSLFGDFAFYVVPKFYPFNATLSGGMSLSEREIKEKLNLTDDVWVHFNLLRQSWDFSDKAVGMKFFNSFNENVIIDGNSDSVDKTIEFKPDPVLSPIREWMLTSGVQGSFFTYAEFLDTTWQTIELYFEDNSSINPDDTGEDLQSFGDQGILFLTQLEDSINLELGFTAYFLPNYFTKNDAEDLAYLIENPIEASLVAIDFPTGVNNYKNGNSPNSFKLKQNYPNPFNSSTNIQFFISKKETVTLKILDITGRTIVTLANRQFNSGSHTVHWNGKNHFNQETPSGVYFYILQSESFSDVKKLILMR